MTLFAEPARPAWMLAHLDLPNHCDRLGVPIEPEPEPEPVDRVRHWVLEDIAGNGLVMRRWRMQTTLAAALWWHDTTTCPPGHRLELTEVVDPATHRRLP